MNKIYLIGNLTADPVLTTTQSGISMCRFSLAVARPRVKDETDYFNVTCWRNTADNCSKFLTKGKKVAVVGSIQMRSYTGQDGTQRTSVDVIAEDVEFLSPRSEGGATPQGSPKDAPALEAEPESEEGLPF